MSSVFYKGVLIKAIEYQEFDQIWTIWTNSKILSFIALGTRKITSKNRIALVIGNYVQIEIFEARFKNKISKLKKAIIIKSIDFISQLDAAKEIQFIFNILANIDIWSEKLVNNLIITTSAWSSTNPIIIATFLLLQILRPIGIFPEMNHCVYCSNNDKICYFSFEEGGFLCWQHANLSLDSKLLKQILLLNENFNIYQKWADLILIRKIYINLRTFLKNYL